MNETQPVPDHTPAPATDHNDFTITMFGADWCIDCRRAKDAFAAQHVPYRYIDLVADPKAADVARDISGRSNIPVIVYPDQSHQVEPSPGDIIAKLRELGVQ